MSESMTNAMESFKEVRKATKIKTHVLWISPTFPHDHPRKGERTDFPCKILNAIGFSGGHMELYARCLTSCKRPCYRRMIEPKLHTCRADSKNSKKKKGAYEEWKRKIDEVNRGEAILSVRMWSGSAYNRLHDGSHPVEIAQFDKDSGIGVQRLGFSRKIDYPFIENGKDGDLYPILDIEKIAQNDGLSFADFRSWFMKADLSKPVALIHFTKFRY